jgi:hypothetical protein
LLVRRRTGIAPQQNLTGRLHTLRRQNVNSY